MTRDDFQEAWELIVVKGFSNYEELTKNERIWFNIEPLVVDGLIDHYINYGAEYNSDTIADLKLLNQHEIAELMIEFNSKFKKGVPADIDDRNGEIGKFKEAFIEEIDEKFWVLNDKLEISLLSHITQNFK
ncbi:DMP19 family protein [Patiriisocius marinus]|uniref:DNA mimic protein DMP19 C-terminal domain-containing protein n=1 Tax=Patiriisocius marinus TaxID=1397112 RepID=A0A5J4IPY1_9FLAO|nr:hypothetical protein [Patiriisocius marinus]GER59809.1 hypothetical protein ULMA_19170 [Patiriisocius marinus]